MLFLGSVSQRARFSENKHNNSVVKHTKQPQKDSSVAASPLNDQSCGQDWTCDVLNSVNQPEACAETSRNIVPLYHTYIYTCCRRPSYEVHLFFCELRYVVVFLSSAPKMILRKYTKYEILKTPAET